MTNNDILYSLSKTYGFNEVKTIEIFALAEHEVTPDQVSQWLKKESDPEHTNCEDITLSIFLNGLISEKRGKKDGPQAEADMELTNNAILKKLKIALNLKNEDLIEILQLADLSMNGYELTSYFRKPGHKNYRPCKDQLLRTFLKAIQLKYNPSMLEQ